MDGFVAVVVAAITTAGTLGVAYIGAKRFNARGNPVEPETTATQLREMLDIKTAESGIWKDKYERAVSDHIAEVAGLRADLGRLERQLELTQFDADDCARRINNLYSELRSEGRISDRRVRKRPASTEG